MLDFNIVDILTRLPGILMAISFHECAHAYTAHLMGDDTAKYQGRISVNPVHHIDPVGFLMLLIARMGWAKPVPVNEQNFKHRKLGIFLVSIAGVTANIILAILLGWVVVISQNWITIEEFYNVIGAAIWINIFFAAFNLLPIPPLDGFQLLTLVLPKHVAYKIYPLERYGFFILVFFIATGIIDRIYAPMLFVIMKTVSLFVPGMF